MKKGYIPKDQRKKILLLSDDIRTHSGIGTMAREIVVNTAHHFNWVNLGGAVKHPDKGKAFDLSNHVNNLTGIEDLVSDKNWHGAGINVEPRGSHLEPHTDFNIHNNMWRRVNVLLFLS